MTLGTHAACDRAAAHAAPEDAAEHPAMVLAVTVLASSLAFIDGSVVNVGLPAIGRSLRADAGDLQWVVNAYLLPLSALLLLGGALGDRLGRRRMLVAGTMAFGIASLGCALAPSLPWLLAARAAQGAAAALLTPTSLALLGSAFSGEARGRAIGTWAAAGAAAGALGPILGGWMIDALGWRSVFLLNLPLAAAAVALALAFVRDPPREPGAPLDLPGAALVTAGLGALTWGLTLGGGRGGWTAGAWLTVAAGAVLLAGFAEVERRRGDRAMAPLAVFGSRSFVGLTLLTLLLYGALGGLLVLLPYLLIEGDGWSATAAGLALLPLPLVIGGLSPLMGGVAVRLGGRTMLTAGPAIVAIGLLLALRIAPGESYWTATLPSLLVIALGMSIAIAPLTTAVLSAVDAEHTGSASGINNAVARTGGLVATALLGAALAAGGEALTARFHAAAIAAALAAVAAGLCALLLVPSPLAEERPTPR